MKKEEKKCPLDLVDWVNYLTFEQDRERYDYYNEEVSFLSTMIYTLTIIVALFGFLSVINIFTSIPDDVKFYCAVISSVVFIVVLFFSSVKWNSYKVRKKEMYTKIDKEARIIEDIIKGNETDVHCISKRYFDICKNRRG